MSPPRPDPDFTRVAIRRKSFADHPDDREFVIGANDRTRIHSQPRLSDANRKPVSFRVATLSLDQFQFQVRYLIGKAPTAPSDCRLPGTESTPSGIFKQFNDSRRQQYAWTGHGRRNEPSVANGRTVDRGAGQQYLMAILGRRTTNDVAVTIVLFSNCSAISGRGGKKVVPRESDSVQRTQYAFITFVFWLVIAGCFSPTRW